MSYQLRYRHVDVVYTILIATATAGRARWRGLLTPPWDGDGDGGRGRGGGGGGGGVAKRGRRVIEISICPGINKWRFTAAASASARGARRRDGGDGGGRREEEEAAASLTRVMVTKGQIVCPRLAALAVQFRGARAAAALYFGSSQVSEDAAEEVLEQLCLLSRRKVISAVSK